jgi:flagellar basal body P-ring protein FlgI
MKPLVQLALDLWRARAGILAAALVAGLAAGCAGTVVRPQSPEEPEASEPGTRLIGDVAIPYGIHKVKVEAVALVTGLKGTGSDPPPSPNRGKLLSEMQRIGVRNPSSILASPNTSLVLVAGYLPAGVQKGDRFDLEVQVPSLSETTSLRGGYLMETRLKELAVLGDGAIHEGREWAVGQGPLMVDPAARIDDNPAELKRARVLGGGVSNVSRPLQLAVHTDASVLLSQQIGEAINRRFHVAPRGIKQGVATPRTDERIDLELHPRYRHNVLRYVQVVRSIAIRESTGERAQRLASLARQLMDPVTAASAALRLEAIGKDAIPALAKGIASDDPEVRFYAAEALAYLDDTAAVEPLAEALRREPAFRAFALAALSAMDDVSAYDALQDLLDAPSAETRYGAFRALWAMNAQDPLVAGEMMGDEFSYHVLDTAGPPMIHATRSLRPELVLFGKQQTFRLPILAEAGNQIMVRDLPDGQVSVSRFDADRPDQRRIVSPSVDEVIRAVVDLGGTYPDVVQLLQEARQAGVLPSRLAIEALPEGGRSYQRPSTSESAAPVVDEDEEESPSAPSFRVSSPLPDLYAAPRPSGPPTDPAGAAEPAEGETRSAPPD